VLPHFFSGLYEFNHTLMINDIIIESCIETVEEAIYAAQNGASQLEVCSSLSKDGLTPDENTVAEIIKAVRIPVKVMIRSREGDFYYSPEEIQVMIAQIQRFKTYKIDGFVFGALVKDKNGNNTLDIASIYQICKAASPYHVTIHKAIDLCTDIVGEIKKVKSISNIKYILTSGGKVDAVSGAKILKNMQKEAGFDIQIIAAGKITRNNLAQITGLTELKYYHGRKIV